ncbi:MAG: cardiolipin synthase [Deltaproteobacteria bacterium HGW-Deltaproteobacteria-7]|nr:MAG: cardiolipin synthase [Deltaproteobacteria bacterium HGW-Deltaproteobacteria-7]PKN18974.1 MAG: cardiolipin synthase [Deltaproteobacteria bacterium HGW-Deltaproteobacteria-6]
MKTAKYIFLFFLFLCLSSFGNGCATLPNVSEKMDEAPVGQKPRPIVSSKGLLSPQKSKAIMERLKRSVNPTDLLERYIAVVESVTESPLTRGNKVTILIDGKATYAAMFEAIRNASDHINLETFIIEDDEIGGKFTDLLLAKQALGVQVNIIYDSVGSIKTPESFFKRLRDGGIRVVEFNPKNPFKAPGSWFLVRQDHRKILVADGKVAIIGGINISNVYSSSFSRRKKGKGKPLAWRDTDIKIEGPAVGEVQKLFLETWSRQQGPALAGRSYLADQKEKGNALVGIVGSTPGTDNRITFIAYAAAITYAEHSIHLTNAYFIPDDQILDAFKDAAKRGVDVKIILPSMTDSTLVINAARHSYSGLLKAGVKIYERRTVLLHAKTAVIDGIWSTVGSTNLDYWSLLSNDEVNAVVLNREFAMEMERMFADDLAQSDQIQIDQWERRPLSQKIKEKAAHLLSRWL